MCRVHKPGSLTNQPPNKGSAQTDKHTTYGPAQVPKSHAKWTIESPTERPGQGRTAPAFRFRHTSSTGALASVSSPPSDGLSYRKAWPKHYLRLRPTSLTGDVPNPCSWLFSDWHDQSRLGPTDRERPLGRDQETYGEKQGNAHKSNHNTRDRTLYTCKNNTLQPPWHNRAQIVV